MGNAQKRKAREKKIQKQLARERARAAMATGPSQARRVVISFDSPSTLARCGPILKAVWSVPRVYAEALAKSGRPVPPPIGGLMLIDTGASQTCIASDVAQEMGLEPIRLAQSYGAHGLQENPVYFAHLEVVFGAPGKTPTAVHADCDASGVKDLHRFAEFMKIKMDGVAPRLVGLLGRDWLMHGTLIYEGSKGRFEFKLDLGSFPTIAPPPPPLRN